MSYVFAIPIIFIIIVAFLKYRIIKEEEIEENERRKIAEELLLFCKDTQEEVRCVIIKKFRQKKIQSQRLCAISVKKKSQ